MAMTRHSSEGEVEERRREEEVGKEEVGKLD
jgi:hypothetical protein